MDKTAIHYKFDKGNSLFSLHNNMDKALKLQILESVDNIYTRSSKKKYLVYINLSCLKVTNHLKSNKKNITPASLKENPPRMTVVYDVNQPFKTITNQIETAVNFWWCWKSALHPISSVHNSLQPHLLHRLFYQ